MRYFACDMGPSFKPNIYRVDDTLKKVHQWHYPTGVWSLIIGGYIMNIKSFDDEVSFKEIGYEEVFLMAL